VSQTEIVRQQLRLFLHSMETAGLDREQGSRFLRLDADAWRQWLGVLNAAPIPDHTAVPAMLRHLGYASNLLSRATN
jgi:hypothetical protein